MPVTKQQLIDEAKNLGLKVEPNAKMADIREQIKEATEKKPTVKKEETKASEQAPAKAGKRSSKAIHEAKELAVKKTRLSEESKETKSKQTQKPPRSKLERRAKAYRDNAKKIETDKAYSISEAIELAKNTSSTKFDATVELHINLAVDPRQAEQNIRDNVVLPAGSGKKLKIAALIEDPKSALDAGADLAGADELIQQIDKGQINFDILIATPALMPKLGKYAKILGPKGLMPNPKSGTVTNDVAKAIKEAKAGRVEYRVDSSGIVHLGVGKVSFPADGLRNNILAIFDSIKNNKPSSVKGNYVKSVYLATSMGPSISVDIPSLNETS